MQIKVMKEIQALTVILQKQYGRFHCTKVIFLTLPNIKYKGCLNTYFTQELIEIEYKDIVDLLTETIISLLHFFFNRTMCFILKVKYKAKTLFLCLASLKMFSATGCFSIF